MSAEDTARKKTASLPHTAPPASSRPNPARSILDDITIDFGPPAELNRLFLQSDTEARAKGIRLSFVPFDELMHINRINSDSWRPLVPIFDPKIGGITPATGFCLVARNARGEAVATTAVRLYSWLDTNLKIEGESLRLFYADPAASKLPGEACLISAPSAPDINGQAIFSGAVWYRPDHRKLGLHDILGRVAKAVALTRWYMDVTFTFMAEPTVKQGFAQRSGYAQVEWDVVLQNSPWGTARLALIWSSTPQLLQSYLFEYSGAADAQVDAAVVARAADQHRRA